MTNLKIGVDKLVGKVSINLLSHAINRLHNQHNYQCACYLYTVLLVTRSLFYSTKKQFSGSDHTRLMHTNNISVKQVDSSLSKNQALIS